MKNIFKTDICNVVTALIIFAALIVFVAVITYIKLIKNNEKDTLEKVFVREWTDLLRENADKFNGLYTGLKHTSEGRLQRKKASLLNEWRLRAHYIKEGQNIDKINKLSLEQLTNESDDKDIIKWAKLLAQAVESAGIVCDTISSVTLNENNINAYSNFNGGSLYVDDKVDIIAPAWYQNGYVIEKGYCNKSE